MKTIQEIIDLLGARPDCKLYKAKGLPMVALNYSLPNDLSVFYTVCGGAELFSASEYPLIISSPEHFLPSNLIVVGEIIEDDITSSWYVVAKGRTDEYISIDCEEPRHGRCYDSYVDRHGVVGSCPIIARTFTEFLYNCLNYGGGRYFWLRDNFSPIGDAYS